MFLEKIYVVSESGVADVLAVIIPTLTSIIGFIVTYRIAKKQISKELDADKKRTALENGKEILSYCAKMLDFKWYKSPECLNEINEMMNKVIAYGSRDAIAILSAYQQYNYTHNFNEKKASQQETCELFSYPCLLLTQVKYDITGEITKPDDFLKIRINDYKSKEGLAEGITRNINQLIDNLDLNKKFKI